MLNQVQLIGHLGQDPEVKHMQDGKLATFTLATTEKWKDAKGIKQEKTEWHRVTIFNEALVKVAESYLRKGSKVFLQGRLSTDRYEKDGQTHYATKIILPNFGATLVMLDKKPEEESA